MVVRTVSFTPAAARALVRLPGDVAKRIRRKIDQLATNPNALANNVTALRGSPFSRLRVGDYRVIFTSDLVVLTIVKIGHRRDVYE
jgi:mRNA interferase RelE/StbE